MYKRWLPAACFSMILGACSSSDGATPDRAEGGFSNAGSSAGLTAGSTSGNDSNGTTGDSASAVAILQGEWATGCLESAEMFRRETLSVDGARMLSETSVYEDQECTEIAVISEALNASTVQRSATTVPTGGTWLTTLGVATEVNFHFEEATVDNRPIPATDFLGRESYLEKIVFDLIFVQNDSLYFGDKGLAGYSGESHESRPVSLDIAYAVYTRVP